MSNSLWPHGLHGIFQAGVLKWVAISCTYSKIFLKAILLEKKAKWVWDVSNKHSENQWGFWPKEKFQWMKSKLKNYTESEYEQDSGIHLIAFLSFPRFHSFTINVKKKKRQFSSCMNLFTPIPSSKTIAFCVNVRVTRRRQRHPTPVLLPGKSHGWRSLVGCSAWGR